jgi:TetR/AcrR family fatty acid metabolism transcriptional regulator
VSAENEGIPDRRRQIIAAAGKVFDDQGYAATTVEAVAAKAGIAKGSIYNYFRNKQDLFEQVCQQAMATGQADLDRLLVEPIPAAEKIGRLVDIWYDGLGQYATFGRLVLEYWATAARQKRHGALTDPFEDMATRGECQIQTIIEQGIASGEFRQDICAPAAAALILATVRGVTIHAIIVGSDVDPDLVAEMKRGLLRSLLAEGRTGDPRQPEKTR